MKKKKGQMRDLRETFQRELAGHQKNGELLDVTLLKRWSKVKGGNLTHTA